MRFFETDWNMILFWLGVWEKLSPAARRYYLEAKSHAQSMNPEGYGDDLGLALSLGLIEQVSTGRVKPTKASIPFRSLMAQLVKWPLFEGKPDRGQLVEYFRKHYASDEEQTLSPWKKPGWDSRERPESFLAANNVSEWEKPFLTYEETTGKRPYGYAFYLEEKTHPKKTWFSTSEITEAAKWIVRRALESKRAWPLQDLVRDLPEHLRLALDPALKACLRHGLLFAALEAHSLDLLVGVSPFILHLANRPTPVPPAVEPCADAKGVPFQVEDMAQVLALAATDECLLNQTSYQRQFFKTVETRLQEEFVPIPNWMGVRDKFFTRLQRAVNTLEDLRFVTDTRRNEDKRRLKATAAGRKWLAQSPADRLREVLFELQRCWTHNKDWGDEELGVRRDSWNDPEDEHSEDLDDFEAETQDEDDLAARGGHGKPRDLLRWQKSVWRQAPTEGCVALDVFLDYHARVSLPDARGQGDLDQEELCRTRLKNFFWRVLVPLGCVEATRRREDQDLWFRLSSAGQYFVGLQQTVQYGITPGAGAVVVQPNFDIVFLGPDLGAEIAIAPFAERCGRNVGTLFRLTRQKIILAVSRGATAEGVLATLAKYSSTAVPENVAAEIRAWIGACRTLAVRHPTLIRTGDAETALRVKQVLGTECAALSPTLLEWPGQDIPPKLITKLREQGLFVEKGK